MFPVIKYVSFDENQLRIPVCIDCLGCDAPYLRNICSVQFSESCFEIIRQVHEDISEVKPILSYDKDFKAIIYKNGYAISYPIDIDKSARFPIDRLYSFVQFSGL